MRLAPTIAAALIVAGSGLPVMAQEVQPAQVDAATPFLAPKLAEDALQAIAGREDTTMLARNEQVAGVADSSVGHNSVTGEARIDGNAFQNMSGLSILNVNTGNNVAINAAMNVNVSITPGL